MICRTNVGFVVFVFGKSSVSKSKMILGAQGQLFVTFRVLVVLVSFGEIE